jgi:excinuclease UvrABC nuclease subunit
MQLERESSEDMVLIQRLRDESRNCAMISLRRRRSQYILQQTCSFIAPGRCAKMREELGAGTKEPKLPAAEANRSFLQ